MRISIDKNNEFSIEFMNPNTSDVFIDHMLKDVGEALKQSLRRNIPRSDIESRYKDGSPKNYDGTPYIHMQDDIKYSVRMSKAWKRKYVSVGGGEYTGYKWVMLDEGWHDNKGTRAGKRRRSKGGTSGVFHKGIHFMQKAYDQAEAKIDQIVERYFRRLAS